ncbi:Malate-2H(+)/Na(+)-lactate antiporter [Kordia antarctica]|uniref:Malate-2H(+)/Na(+)-lactate antiporter n=1 Tax=Kordia antarctica TaxID=1218801 RepID=A0A7L4ZRT6_9FLAO|nr:Na+/H+ antiporter NhaC family protein [Kordia antarctica]QHI39170.1 Malate-2H(+)/Na(+)-lactate antiporter [Kordia antarctica]
MESQDIKPREPQDENIIENKELNIWEALIPVIVLVIMLAFNVYVYGDDALSGSNQFILLIGAAVAAIVGFFNRVTYKQMLDEVAENVKSTTGALLILLFVGSLAGTWLISGVIPSMIYYGLQILNPTIFLPACVVICAIISIATGSSWTTSATVGIALIGIGNTLGISAGMTAGAVISGAYFGDKMSPLSDTTNLAPTMAGGELFAHIKYMAYTTFPTIIVTLIAFIIIGLNIDTVGTPNITDKLAAIDKAFNITPWLFLVPAIVIFLIIRKTPPLIALMIGTLLGGLFAILFQTSIIWTNGMKYDISTIPEQFKDQITWKGDDGFSQRSNNNYQTPGTYELVGNESNITLSQPILLNLPKSDKKFTETFTQTANVLKDGQVIGSITINAEPTGFLQSAYFATLNAMTVDTSVETSSAELNDLFSSSGMKGMLGTIWLIICAMVFGGVMDGIGALARISKALLSLATTVFGLFASTVASCLALNITASDQYLAIVVPGKMFKKAYEDKGLAPENLSRTLEDAGTVTSVLVPWNTCGAYQSGVLGVGVGEYFFYAIFNWLSPFTTLLFAAFKIKIKQLATKTT